MEEIRTPNPQTVQLPDDDGRDIKRLIICADGTWQSSDQGPPGVPTNVSRLARAINAVHVKPDGHEIQQIVFYQSGVGSGNLGTIQRSLAGGLGLGLDQHVREAYAFLAHNYNLNDEIFLFGFSRGAYTARAVAGVISTLGILTKSGMENFNQIYEEYKKGPVSFRKFKQSKEVVWESQPGFEIKVVGCFDTVGSVGLPENWVTKKLGYNKKFAFHNTQLSRGIENAFHALALNEHRQPFSPTLWYLPEMNDPPINLVQCWFPGVHTNVGGGYDDQEIADITFCWMIDRCRHFLSFDDVYLNKLISTSGSPKLKLPHDPDATPAQRIAQQLRDQQTAWSKGTVYNSSTGIMSLSGTAWRTPGQYPYPGKTMECMHPAVRVRYVEDELWKAKCKALNGLTMTKEEGKFKWKIRGRNDEVREWEMAVGGWEEKLAGPNGLARIARDVAL